jgi:hypothetical protein
MMAPPNILLERTGESVRFLAIRESGSCHPPLSGASFAAIRSLNYDACKHL